MLNNTFIISAQENWCERNISLAQHLALELAKQHKVLYVNPPSEVFSPSVENKKPRIGSKNRALVKLSENIWLLNPPMINPKSENNTPQSISDYLTKLSSRHYARIINWATNSLGFRNSILINDNDPVRNYLISDYINPWLSIFFYHDPEPELDLHQRYLRASNIIITSSQSLAERIRPYNFNTFNIGYGVEFSLINENMDLEAPISEIPIPRIGVIAPLDSRELSLELLYKTALNFPLCSLVLAGEMDEQFKAHALLKLPNVFCCPKKDFSLVQHMNICINPQHYHSLSLTASKESIIHYLYEGKSVVSTSSISASDLAPYVYLSGNDTNFFELIKAALEEKISEKTINSRIKFAQNMSWENCTERIYSIIDMFERELRENYGNLNPNKGMI